MKYIIVGGNGFLGSHLVQSLYNKGEEILICDINRSRSQDFNDDRIIYQQVDITNNDSIKNIKIDSDDVVIHLAANQYHNRIPRNDREKFFMDTNYHGTQNILDAMNKNNCSKLIYFSTDMVYGKPRYLPVDTLHPHNPFGPYGKSKKESEILCNNFREIGMNITIFRPRMIIGPGRLGILKKLFKLISLNLPVPLIGNGQNCYQMISVFDCVSAIEKALIHGIPNQEFNLGSKNPPTVYELLSELISSVKSKSLLVPTNGKMVKSSLSLLASLGIELLFKEQYMIADENYLVDVTNTERILNWEPLYTDKDMIFKAYEFYKKPQPIN
ncbi:NAD-dependent epimerase/dehydratase family protein [Paenibacillus sp. TAB 01]|uniref:NAD-dependent epimerase/dehydratase family protein n=1 Tax=Paenibacillus sp. TAB 01 TaxID=3368988 RepID=UPI00375226D8